MSKYQKPSYSAKNDTGGVINVRTNRFVVKNSNSKYLKRYNSRSTDVVNGKSKSNRYVSKYQTPLVKADVPCGCDGGLVSLTLKYIGQADQDIVVEGQITGDIFFDDTVSPDEEFTMAGTNGPGGRMDNTIDIYYNTDQTPTTSIHISCSEPLDIGMIFGEFQIVAGVSRVGELPLCDDICQPGSFPDCFGVCDGPGIRDCQGNCYNPNEGPPQVFEDCLGVCAGTATMDCSGICNGPHELDCAGNCYNPRTDNPPVSYDCNGVCGGSSVPDCLGVCDGTSVLDCNGVCNGDAYFDCNGVCGGTSHVDCLGVCGGNATYDCDGHCYDPDIQDPPHVRDCSGECNGNHYKDCGGHCISDDCFQVKSRKGGKKFIPEIKFRNKINQRTNSVRNVNNYGSIKPVKRNKKKTMFISKNM